MIAIIPATYALLPFKKAGTLTKEVFLGDSEDCSEDS